MENIVTFTPKTYPCYLGFRATAFLQLTCFSYHADEPYFIGGIKTKAGRDRMIPIHPRIQPYVDAWLSKGRDTMICTDSGSPILYHYYAHKCFAPVAEAMGVPQAPPHWFRDIFSTKLFDAGVDELLRKRLMGHSDKDITDHYTGTDLKMLNEAIRKMA